MKTCKKLYHLSKAVAVISLFVVVLVGCGGGGGAGAGVGAPFSTLVSGVAAAGAPITGHAFLKDSANHTIGPVAIGADGSFSFDVVGLTPPFYLLADGYVGPTHYSLYSVTTSANGIANINPLTNAVVAAAAGGIDPVIVYGDPAAHPVTKANLDKAITDLRTMLRPLLAEHGAENIDPISDSFTADGTKLDAVFDEIKIAVDPSGSDVLIVVTDKFTGLKIAEASADVLENPTISYVTYVSPSSLSTNPTDFANTGLGYDWDMNAPVGDSTTGAPGFGKSSLFSAVTGAAHQKYATLRISPKLVLKTDVLLSDILSISYWTKQEITGPRTWQLRIYTVPTDLGPTGDWWYKTRLNTDLYYPIVTTWQLNSTNGTPDYLLKFEKITTFVSGFNAGKANITQDTHYPAPSAKKLADVIVDHGTESLYFIDIAAGDNSSGPISAYLDGVTIKTTKGNIVLDLTDSVIPKGADRLVATQNNDGGWEWENPDTNLATMPTPTGSYANTLGVTAQGLLDAYKISKKSVYLNACIVTYNRLLSNSTNSDPAKHKIRGTDITFLVELSEVTGNSTYAAFAKDWYKATLHDFGGSTRTATGLAEFVRDGRKSSWPALISWDINLYIQGVLALDRYYPGQKFDTDAKSMAGIIYNSLYGTTSVDFNLSDSTKSEYWLSYTGAIEAFTATGLHSVEKDSLKSTLIASQQPAGNFVGVNGGSDVQTTAYAVMALLKAGGNDANEAAKKGVKYLVNTQSANGGWVENTTDNPTVENTEVTSEAIHAIYNFQK
jgi:hypothetical protein